MTTTTWINTAGGNFDTAANWSNGVPSSFNDTALITAKGTYTVTVSQADVVGTLQMAKGATLAIQPTDSLDVTAGTGTGKGALAGTINVANGAELDFGTDGDPTTFNNTGAINLQSSGDPTDMFIAGNVTLTGKGKVNLALASIVSDGTAGSLTNGSTSSGNTISGTGLIGDEIDANLSFTNAAKGIVDATGGELAIGTGFAATVTNNGLMEATGNSGDLSLESNVTQGTRGKIEAASAGSRVDLESVTITGGVISIATGASLFTDGDVNAKIANTTPMVNNGTLDMLGSLEITGSVTGKGQAQFNGTGNQTLKFDGASSTNVSIGDHDTLDLVNPRKFTGTVSGLTNPGSAIDLENISFANAEIVSYTKGVLTVTDTSSKATDKIKIAGGVSFTIEQAADNSALIEDPLANAAGVSHADTNLLVQSMAAFGAGSSIAGSATGHVADYHTSANFLAINSHHG